MSAAVENKANPAGNCPRRKEEHYRPDSASNPGELAGSGRCSRHSQMAACAYRLCHDRQRRSRHPAARTGAGVGHIEVGQIPALAPLTKVLLICCRVTLSRSSHRAAGRMGSSNRPQDCGIVTRIH